MDTERMEKRIRSLSGERRTFILPPELKGPDDIEMVINVGGMEQSTSTSSGP